MILNSFTLFTINLPLRGVLFVCKAKCQRHRSILTVVFFIFVQIYFTTQSILGPENVREAQQPPEVQHKFQLYNRTTGIRFEKGIEHGVPPVHDQATAVSHHQSKQPVIARQPDGGQCPPSSVQLSTCSRRHTVKTVQFA